MKIPFGSVTFILMMVFPGLSATKDDGWENLSHVTWQRSYTFVARDLHCVTGEIVSVSADSLSVKLPKGGVTKLDRADILRVTSDSYYIYSGRSSWSDVMGYKTYPGEGVRIQTKKGETHHGKLLGISDSDITVWQTDGSIKIAKGDVSKIDIVSGKPLTYSDEYWLQECFYLPVCVLDVHLWPRWVGIGRMMRVRLYNSSVPEDNRPLTCKADG
jgi:hypothetical protein